MGDRRDTLTSPDFWYFPPQQGFPGSPGSDGDPIIWRGDWDAAESYAPLDVVRYGDALYIATEFVGPSADPPDVATTNWDFLIESQNSYGNIDGGTPTSIYGGTEPLSGGSP